jgi:hypothetical protein
MPSSPDSNSLSEDNTQLDFLFDYSAQEAIEKTTGINSNVAKEIYNTFDSHY